jgi:hypothetical protein
MKKILLIILLIAAQSSNAQIAIGNTATDPSAILDLTASSKGLSVPRMNTIQRDAIDTPAIGLLIYNTDDADYNSYNGAILGWQDFSTGYKTVNATGDISTSSDVAATATGMTLTPKAGTYSVLFNSQYKNAPNTTITPGLPVSVTSILTDLASLIADLDSYFIDPLTEAKGAKYDDITHTHYVDGVNDGNPISNSNINFDLPTVLTVYPGAYYNGAAINFQFHSTITLDGLGDPNAKFIFKANAAINTNIGATFKLVNGAQACNVFFLANGGMSIGAAVTGRTTNISVVGNWVSRAGAIAVGIGTNIDGRILTSAGALTMGDGTLKVATGTSFVNLRSLVSFLAFTSAGAINITGAPATTDTYLTGDLYTCTDAEYVGFGIVPELTRDPATIFPITTSNPVTLDGRLYNCNFGPSIAGSGTTTVAENNVDSTGTFGIYKNGVEIPNATKTTKTDSTASTITLQTIATVNGNDIIDVRWKTAAGNTLLMGNRNLTLIKVQ